MQPEANDYALADIAFAKCMRDFAYRLLAMENVTFHTIH